MSSQHRRTSERVGNLREYSQRSEGKGRERRKTQRAKRNVSYDVSEEIP